MRFLSLAGAATLTAALLLPSASGQAVQTDAEREALFWQRRADAQTNYTDADVSFMTGMIGHHAQALVMSRLAPTNGASRSVSTLAARIINAQRDEIATMQRWLSDRDEPVPHVTEAGETMMPPGVADPHAGHSTPSADTPAHTMPDADGAHPIDASGMHPDEHAEHAAASEHGAGHDAETHARHMADGTHARHVADGTAAEHHAGDAASGAMDHGSMDHGSMDHGSPESGSMEHAGHDMGAGGMTMMDHSGMPGMLSASQLDELRAARGVDFDRLFLRYMIQHHGGAIVMVDELIAQDGAAQDEQSFRLAADVRVDQTTEIARMQMMLDAIPD